MPDYAEIYQKHAQEYDMLISREDYLHNLYWRLAKITPFDGLNVVEFGAGTGRLTTMLAPVVATIRAYDSSEHMLSKTVEKLSMTGLENWYTEVGDHRSISAEDASADLAISGWSMCYLALGSVNTWREELDKGFKEMQRVVREDGLLIIIETLGTGFDSPHPPAELKHYFDLLKKKGFKKDWIRTDYLFRDLSEAITLTNFFFGEETLDRITSNDDGVVLPECTGIWWRKRTSKLF